MKFGKHVAKVVLAAALATAFISAGCEGKPADTAKPAPAPAKVEPKK